MILQKLTDDEKSDFKDISKNIDNYISQQFNYYEYIDRLRKLDIYNWLIANNHVCHFSECDIRVCCNKYLRFLHEQLYDLKDELKNNYLNIYKKDDLKISDDDNNDNDDNDDDTDDDTDYKKN